MRGRALRSSGEDRHHMAEDGFDVTGFDLASPSVVATRDALHTHMFHVHRGTTHGSTVVQTVVCRSTMRKLPLAWGSTHSGQIHPPRYRLQYLRPRLLHLSAHRAVLVIHGMARSLV